MKISNIKYLSLLPMGMFLLEILKNVCYYFLGFETQPIQDLHILFLEYGIIFFLLWILEIVIHFVNGFYKIGLEQEKLERLKMETLLSILKRMEFIENYIKSLQK